jgi:hypothetical protein
MFRTFFSFVVLAVAFAASNVAQAAILVSYDFDPSGNAPSSSHPNVTTTNFLAGSGVNNVTFVGQARGRSFRTPSSAVSLAQGRFWEFTVTALPGKLLTLDTLDLTSSVDVNGPPLFDVYVNGTPIVLGTGLSTSGSHSIDISQASPPGGVAHIQLVGYLAVGTGSSAEWFLDNVTLNGTATPEPGGILLAALLIPGFFIARRRMRRGQPSLVPSVVAAA